MKLTLEKTLERYQRSVYKAAFSVCRNAADAEDIAQETFLAYYKNNRDFNDEDHIKAWLIKVAINKARNMAVSFWKKQRIDIPDFEAWLRENQSEYQNELQNRDVLKAVMELPEKQRIVIHLFYYEGYKAREIAKLLDMKEGSIRVQLHRGRRMLREKLQEEWDYE